MDRFCYGQCVKTNISMDLSSLSQQVLHSSRGGLRAGAGERHVHRDWFLILFFAAALFAGVSFWSFYLYSGIERGDFFTDDYSENQGIAPLHKEKLDSVVSFIVQKSAQYDALKVAPPVVQDPSQ